MLAQLARPRLSSSVTWTPLDHRWYEAIGGSRSDAGVSVVPETALTVAVVFRAINVLAHSIASIPLVVYRRLENEGKEKARTHPAYDLLHDKPNAWMTSFRWRHLLMTQTILWGDHYSQIMPGPGAIGQLVPLNPNPTATRIVDQLADGRLLYVTRDEKVASGGGSTWGPERRLLQDEILHVRGFSIDGKRGIPLTRVARNAMGLALAAERHGSMFMRQGANHAGYLYSDGLLNEPTRKSLEASWQRARGGPEGSGKTPLLSHGLKFEKTTANHRESQWIESRTFQVEELLRFIGVPGVLCGYADKTATYASAEQFFLNYVTHTVRPWTENISQELNAAVITGGSDFFADFILEGLLRGDIKTRYDAHRIAITAGWKSRNEARLEENMNKGPAALDEFLEPLNMVEAGEERNPSAGATSRRRPAVEPDDEEEEEEEDDADQAQRMRALVGRVAQRIVRKEVSAILGSPSGKLGAAKRFAAEPEKWRAWLAEFYTGHAAVVSSELGVSAGKAASYCEAQRSRIETGGVAVVEKLEEDSTVRDLVNMTMGGD